MSRRCTISHYAFVSSLLTVFLLIIVVASNLSAATYPVPQTAEVTLAWDPNDPAPEGYCVYQRKTGEVYDYSTPCWIGPATSSTIYNLDWDTTYHFVVRAYLGSEESADSQEVAYTTPPSDSTTPSQEARVTSGQLVLYRFDEGQGDVVHDVSGNGGPLDLTIVDGSSVTWMDDGGLSIDSPTIIRSAGNASKLHDMLTATGEVTIEAWVKPSNTTQSGPARIVTFSQDPYYRNFTLGQNQNAYDVRLRTSDTSTNGLPSTMVDAQASTNLTHVVYTRDPTGSVALYIDGSVSSTNTVAGTFTNWQDCGFGIANELTGDRPWLGELYLVSVYDRSLSDQEVGQNYAAGITTASDSTGQTPSHTITTFISGNGSLAPSGSIVVEDGSDQTITISPATGYRIADVQVDSQSVGPVTSYTFTTVTSDQTFEVVFSPHSYEMAASSTDGGTISPSGNTTVMYGSTQTYSIQPYSGYHLVDVTVDGVSVGAITSYTFSNVSAPHSIYASFEGIQHRIVATADGNGTISPAGTSTVADGSSFTISIQPDAGHYTQNIVVDGLSVGSLSSFTFSDIHEDHDVVVSFAANTYAISVAADGGGSVSPAGQVLKEHGTDLVVTATPQEGYEIVDVIVDGASLGPVNPLNLSDITSDHQVRVEFSESMASDLSMEVGRLSVDHNWKRVTYVQTYTDPIVTAGPLSSNDDAPAVIRIRNVDKTGFEIAIQEWDYLDGTHGLEEVSYLVMERGHHTLENGFQVEAGRFETDSIKSFSAVSFQTAFVDTPVVVVNVATDHEFDAVASRIRNVNSNGFDYRMQEQQSNAKSHAVESVHYIAWEPSAGIVNCVEYEVSMTGNEVTHNYKAISRNPPFDTANIMLGDMQTFDGGDTANVRSKKDELGMHVQIDEEQSKDDEVRHTTEIVGYMVFLPEGRETSGQIAFYDFKESAGGVVHDHSGVGTPMDLTIADPNAVEWIPGGGISIASPTLIQSAGTAGKINEAVKASGEVSIEVWVKPQNTTQGGPARIVTLSQDPYYRNLTLGQDRGSFDVRLRTTATSLNGLASTNTAGGVSTQLTHVVYTRDAEGMVNIYINGGIVMSNVVSGDMSNWNDYAFALGNELTGDRPWLGEIHQVALYDRALSSEDVQQNYDTF